MNKHLTAEIEKFRMGLASSGEDIVFQTFPSKSRELQEMIQSFDSSSSPFHSSHASTTTDAMVYPPPDGQFSEDPPTKKRRMAHAIDSDGMVLQNARFTNSVVANRHISGLHAIVKQECEQLSSTVDQVKVWITLTMPKIEDGDNFGVQIQEEVLSELHRAQESAYNLRDTARQDHITRAKLCSKLIKYPNLEDYTEHDEKQIYFARQHIIDIRNMYASLMDLIQKNIAKIRVPKANNSRALY
ncbi:proteasome activator pa28, REG alpha/beta subunit [Guyanagaster necrorhizus]|uniref:Proteasome activator pa28, REG alpha/beta subunit n=1 Tax=Guyanagaster necrorhizus TaxID=856835 RepID=A0A9P7W4Q3_9AGAR|nr:proteasome activator pa28, REG alpha/beta subunit [Guyanagaster necrorhizus MCA 3950]KAG7452410.1 proteasome activator pa28, REG alpha/beta subunit [Guyanagaster necrorhizus MCA 3950]